MLPFMQLCGVAPVLLAWSLPVVNGELRGLGSPLAKAKGAPHNDTIKLAAAVPQPSQPGPGSTPFAQPEWSSTKDVVRSSGGTPVVAPAPKSAKLNARRLQAGIVLESTSSPDYQETRIAARGELGKELGAATAVLIHALWHEGEINGATLRKAAGHFVMGTLLAAATIHGNPVAMFVANLASQLFPSFFPQEPSVDEKLEEMRQQIMEDVNLLVDSALFQQEFEQSQMHIAFFFREMGWADRFMMSLEPQARLAYILSLEREAESLRNSLYRPCIKSWGSTECQNTILGGGIAMLQGLMVCHFSLMRAMVFNLASTLENQEDESLKLETFNYVGCPNVKPSLDGWTGSNSVTVLEDMYNTCRLNLGGTASQEQQEQCCGSMQPCKPVECLHLSQYYTSKHDFLQQVMEKYQRVSDDYRQLWAPSVRRLLAERLEQVETLPSFSDYQFQLGKVHADTMKSLSQGNQLMTPMDKLGDAGVLDVTLGPNGLCFGFDVAQAEDTWGENNVEGLHSHIWANGLEGSISLYTNDPSCGPSPNCGCWDPVPADPSLPWWQPGDKIRVTDVPGATRTYYNKMAGWALIEWTSQQCDLCTYSFGKNGRNPATSVKVNGETYYPSLGKTLSGLDASRRRFSSGGDSWRFKDGEPFRVHVKVPAGNLQVSFGSDVVRSFSVHVSPDPFPRDQTFSEKVEQWNQGSGCDNETDQYWTCAGKGPELVIKQFAGDAVVRFKMRIKDNANHSAAGIALGVPDGSETKKAFLLLDVSDSKPTLAVEGGFFGVPKDIGDSPIRSAVWHDYEVGRVGGAFYVLMDGKMLVHKKSLSVNEPYDRIVVRPWRNQIDVKDIKYESVRNTITVLGTYNLKHESATGKYFNFNMDDLGLPEDQVFSYSTNHKVTFMHCRGGTSMGSVHLKFWTFNGADGGDSHGRKDSGEADGDWQTGDKITTARSCEVAG